MHNDIRVSQISIINSLRKYLADELADDILKDILETEKSNFKPIPASTVQTIKED